MYVNTATGEKQKTPPDGFKRDDNYPWLRTQDASGNWVYVRKKDPRFEFLSWTISSVVCLFDFSRFGDLGGLSCCDT